MSVRIIDADTIELTTPTGATVRMRASDYDALESATPGGKLATDYAEQTGLQPGERQGRDRYGRQLNQLTDNQGQPAGQRMVRQGFAFANSPETVRAQRDFIAFGPESENDSAAQQIVNQMMALRQDQPVLPGGFGTVDFERNDRRSTTARALDRGTENLKNSFLTFARVATDALGWDETSRELGQQALYHMEKAQVIPADMASLKDVEAAGWTPKALATFAYERLIEEVPSLLVDAGLTATGVGAGAAIGRRAGMAAVKGMAEEQAKDTVLAAQKKGAKTGAAVGFAASTYPQSVAQVQQELDAHGVEDANPLIALTGGAVVAGVQMAPEVILAARMLKQAGGDAAAKTFGEAMKNIAKGTAIGVAAEGSAEALATTISKEIAKAHPDANYSNWTEDDFWQLLDATAAGAAVGGTLGGASSLMGDVGGYVNDRLKTNFEARQQEQSLLGQSETPQAPNDELRAVPELDAFLQEQAATQRPATETGEPATTTAEDSVRVLAEQVLAPEQPVAEQPVEVQPEQPVAEQPVEVQAEQPVAEQPVEVQPEQPVAEQPVAEQPVAEQPVEAQTAQSIAQEIITQQTEPAELQAPATGNQRRQFGIGQLDGDNTYRESGISAFRQLKAHLDKAGSKFKTPEQINPFDPSFSDLLERMARAAKARPRNEQGQGGTMTRDEIDRLMNEAAVVPLRQDGNAPGVRDLLGVMARNVDKLGESQRDIQTKQAINAFINTIDPNLPQDLTKAFARLRVKMARGFRFDDAQLAAIDSFANAMYIPTGEYKQRNDAGRMEVGAKRSAPIATDAVLANQNALSEDKPLQAPVKTVPVTQPKNFQRKKEQVERLSNSLSSMFTDDRKPVIAELAGISLNIAEDSKGRKNLGGNNLVNEILAAFDERPDPNRDSIIAVTNTPDRETGETDPEAVNATVTDLNNPDSVTELSDIGQFVDMDGDSKPAKISFRMLKAKVQAMLENGELSADAQAFSDDYLKAIGWKKSRIANTDTATKIAAVSKRMADDYDRFVQQPTEKAAQVDLEMATYVAYDLLRWYSDNVLPRTIPLAVYGQGKAGKDLVPFAKAVKEYLSQELGAKGLDINGSDLLRDLETFAEFGKTDIIQDNDGKVLNVDPDEPVLDRKAVTNSIQLNYQQRKALSNYLMPTIQQINSTPELVQFIEANDFKGLLNFLVDGNIIPFNNSFGKFMRESMDYNSIRRIPNVMHYIRGGQPWGLMQDMPNARKDAGVVTQRTYRGMDPKTGQMASISPPAVIERDAKKLPKPDFNNVPLNESVPVLFNITSPTQEDGTNTTAIRSRFHILDYVMNNINTDGLDRVNLSITIRDMVNEALVDLISIDPRLLAASIDVSSKIPDATIVYREQPEKGEKLEYTWGEVRRLSAELENRASSYVSSVTGQHRYSVQNEKVMHLRQLERYMNALADNVLFDPQTKDLTDLGRKLARSMVSLDRTKYAESETNLKRLLGQLYLATYGRGKSHLDPRDQDVDQTERNLRELRGAEHLLSFTEDDIDVSPEFEQFAQQVNAEREESRTRRSNDKKEGKDTEDYTIASDFVNLDKLEQVINWLQRSELLPEVSGDPFTIDNFKKHFNGLTDARTRLAEMERDPANDSKLDDLLRINGIDRDDLLGTNESGDIGGGSFSSAEKQLIKAASENSPYSFTPDPRVTLTAAMRRFATDLQRMGNDMSPERVFQSAAQALVSVFNLDKGTPISINFGSDREVSVGYVDGQININLTPMDPANPRESLARAITELSHELAHLVAHVDRLDDTDLKFVFKEFDEFRAKNIVSRNYTIDEYLADRVATVLMQNLDRAVTAAQNRADDGVFSRIAQTIMNGLKAAFNMVKDIFPGRNFSPLKPYSDVERVVFRLLGRPAYLADTRYFDGAPKGNMAKVKQLAPKIVDNKMANFFKPVARRLQNIDRTLARMFYTPPGAKQVGKTAGLMDEAIHRRKQFVAHVSRLYPDHKDFSADYNQYLDTGKSSPRLTAAFKVMADELKSVNGTFEFKGVPVMFLNDDIAVRKAEMRKLLLAVDNNPTWADMVDGFLASFDDRHTDYNSTDIRPGNPLNGAKHFNRLRDEHPQIIPILRNSGFIRESSAAVLNYFIGGVATRIEFERIFGAMDKKDGKEFWNPSKKLTDRLDAITDSNARREAVRTIHSMLGFDSHKVRPAWRTFNDWAVTLTSWAVLPFSGFASIPDLIMPFIRNRTWMGAFKGMARVSMMMATNPKRVKDITRAYSLASSAIHDTVWAQMASSNAFLNKTPGALSSALFKLNGLELITKISRNVAAVLAIDTVLDHASRNDSESRRFLSELGLTRDQAIAIKQYMDINDTVPVFDPNASEGHNALADAASRAVTLFTNESVIHPNRGQLPAVMNDPRYRVFTLLKPFLYGFGSIIYGGTYREMRSRFLNSRDLGEAVLNSPLIVSPLVLAFALMMPMAAIGLELREWLRDLLAGDDTYSNRLDSLTDKEYLARILSRAGGAGYLEIPMMVMDGWDWGQTYGEKTWNAAVRLAGPVAGVADQIRKDIQNENRTLPRFGVWDPNELVK